MKALRGFFLCDYDLMAWLTDYRLSIVWLVCNAVFRCGFVGWRKGCGDHKMSRWPWTPNNLWTRGGSTVKINQFEGYFGHTRHTILRYSSSESGVGKHCNVRELYVNSSFSPSSRIVTSRKFSDFVGRTRSHFVTIVFESQVVQDFHEQYHSKSWLLFLIIVPSLLDF